MTVYNQVAVAIPSKNGRAARLDEQHWRCRAASNISRPGSWMTAATDTKHSTRPLSVAQRHRVLGRAAGRRISAKRGQQSWVRVPSMQPLLESSREWAQAWPRAPFSSQIQSPPLGSTTANNTQSSTAAQNRRKP
mmetsp:Transcript_12453/g.14259  ORF Transcript_12453/g.14259 Transcript_12453/m.14259 type:complete len:135 (+) Transcript_12453:3-407(+)